MKTQCETCAHTNVCSHKKQYEKVVQTLKDRGSFLENRPFNITVACRFYSNERS